MFDIGVEGLNVHCYQEEIFSLNHALEQYDKIPTGWKWLPMQQWKSSIGGLRFKASLS